MKYIYCYFLALIVSIVSNAQNKDLSFETIQYDEKFPQSTVSKILQSKNGFIWIGTENGLVRYDGYNFLRFYTHNKDNGTISNNFINDIYEDTEENLWVATNHGVNLYNKDTNKFRIIDLPPIKGGRNYIAVITEDDQQNLWVGTNKGLKVFNKQSYLLENIFQESNLILSNYRILSLFFDKDYGFLVGTNKGLQCFDPKSGLNKKLPKIIAENKNLLQQRILKIAKDKKGNLWFATENNGAFLYSIKKNKVINYRFDVKDNTTISSNNIKDILMVDDDVVWFATDDGLNVFEKKSEQFVRYYHNALIPSTVNDNNINSLFKDKDGSVWIGTNTGSIDLYNKSYSNFMNINENVSTSFGLNNPTVNTLLKDVNGSFWIGTNGGGLSYLNSKKQKIESYPIDLLTSKNIITSLVNKDEDNLLCGTLFGLKQYHKKTKKFKDIFIDEDEVKVSCLFVDEDETIWVGTDGTGLIKLPKDGNVEKYQKNIFSNSISDNFIIDIENTKEGLFISTQYGLNFFDKKTKQFTRVLQGKDEKSLSSNTLSTMFTDSKGKLWIGMGYGGLNYYDEESKTFHLLNESIGFTDGAIKSISEDSKGNLWVSSNNLLFQIKIKQFSLPFKKSNFEITSYTSKNGIAVKNYETNCSVKLDNNQLVFGGANGLTIFNPENIVEPKIENKIVLTKLFVNNKEIQFSEEDQILRSDISEASEINLEYNQKYVGFEFSALNFINSEKTRYAYKLESTFDKDDWHKIGSQNKVNLTALTPGNYTFKLNTIDKNGDLGTNIKTLKINITPPLWRTQWAYFAYLLLILVVLYFIMNFIKSKVIIQQALLSKERENERQAELYNMKLDFFTNISHEIRTPLTLIQGPVEELLETSEKNTPLDTKLTLIKKNSDRLLTLINELLDFRKIESKQRKMRFEEQDIVAFCFDIYESFKGLSVQKNIDYKFVMNTKEIFVFFDKKQMEKVVYNLLSNAFKFTKKNGKIVISIEESNDDFGNVLIKIKDNGIGIPSESKKNVFKNFFQVDERGQKNKGSGIGLALSKNIVELHHGVLSIESIDNSWEKTVFIISLLKGKKHLDKFEIAEELITIEELKTIQNIGETKNEESIEIIDDVEEEEDNKKTVLVIDDHKEIRKFITEILKEEYTIVSFSSAKEALSYMEKQIPDIIVCDVMMPEMDGFEFCNEIKTNESTNHIPVILLTAKASIQNRIDGLSFGADAYITKPFSVKVLKLNILNLLSSKEVLRQKYSGSFIVDSSLDTIDVPEEKFIKKLMGIIELNIENSDFDVNQLVKEIGMSRTVLYKKVKTLTNHSVASLIKHVRLKKAADILLKTNYNISEVSYMVGFSDRKHFSKEFKKIYNVSPTDYKNSQS